MNDSWEWVFDVETLKNMVLNFFQRLYTDEGCYRTRNTLHGFPTISAREMGMVTRTVTMEDVKMALFDMAPHKAPESMVFQLLFSKRGVEIRPV